MAHMRVDHVFVALIIISFLLGNSQYSTTNFVSVDSSLHAVSVDDLIFGRFILDGEFFKHDFYNRHNITVSDILSLRHASSPPSVLGVFVYAVTQLLMKTACTSYSRPTTVSFNHSKVVIISPLYRAIFRQTLDPL